MHHYDSYEMTKTKRSMGEKIKNQTKVYLYVLPRALRAADILSRMYL